MFQISALLTGAIISIMVAVNGVLTGICGVYTATVIIHIVAVIFAGFILLIGKTKVFPDKKLPLWMYSAGIIGVFSTVFTNYAFGKISMIAITALALLAQTATSFIIDAFGLFGANKREINLISIISLVIAVIGIGVMLIGAEFTQFVALAVSFASGITLVVSRMINADLAKTTGAVSGSFINHLVGLPAALIAMLILGSTEGSIIQTAVTVPWWAYLGGILGITVVVLNNCIVPKISAMQATLLLFVGQIFAGAVIDYLTGVNSSKQLMIGAVIVAIGVCTSSIADNKKKTKS